MNQRAELGIADCDKCKKMLPQLNRQSLGCGYEPAADGRVHLTMWQPPSGAAGYAGPTPTVCAGYSTRLPEVQEVSIARMHWDTGNIGAAFGGDPPTEYMLHAIAIYAGAGNAVRNWAMTPASEGGGGK